MKHNSPEVFRTATIGPRPYASLTGDMIKRGRTPIQDEMLVVPTTIVGPSGEHRKAFAIVSAEDFIRLGYGRRDDPRLAAL